MDETLSNSWLQNVYLCWDGFLLPMVKVQHLDGLNFINHVSCQLSRDVKSSCSISRSWVEVIGEYRRQSSANNLVLEVTVFGRSLMYSRNHKGPVTVP